MYVSARLEVYCSALAENVNVSGSESESENGSESADVNATELAHESENVNHQGKLAANMCCWVESVNEGAEQIEEPAENGSQSVYVNVNARHGYGLHSMYVNVHGNENVPIHVDVQQTSCNQQGRKLHGDDAHPWRTSQTDLPPIPAYLREEVDQYASRVDPDLMRQRLYDCPARLISKNLHALNSFKHDEDGNQDEKNSVCKSG